jgi:hypothetical protein
MQVGRAETPRLRFGKDGIGKHGMHRDRFIGIVMVCVQGAQCK